MVVLQVNGCRSPPGPPGMTRSPSPNPLALREPWQLPGQLSQRLGMRRVKPKRPRSSTPERRPRHQLSSREVGQYGKHQGGKGRGAESSANQKEGAQQLSPVLSTCSMSQMPCKVGAATGPPSPESFEDKRKKELSAQVFTSMT